MKKAAGNRTDYRDGGFFSEQGTAGGPEAGDRRLPGGPSGERQYLEPPMRVSVGVNRADNELA
jgi:hypothetical protein